MTRYRQRPVVVEAVQFCGLIDITPWLVAARAMAWPTPGAVRIAAEVDAVEIATHEGVMLASVGDWIIRGVKGELYSCKPGVFYATHEPVPSDDDANIGEVAASTLTRPSTRSLALMVWFVARGATAAGQFPGDPDDCQKQNQARDDFDRWWTNQ